MSRTVTQNSASSPGRKNRSIRSVALRLLIAALLLSILFVTLIGPPAPSEITIYTGPEGTTFFEHGPRYAAALARNGIDARLIVTQGSLEHAPGLSPMPQVDVGDGGIVHRDHEIRSMANRFQAVSQAGGVTA